MKVEAASPAAREEWLPLRAMLWPEASNDEHRGDIERMLRNPVRFAAFLVRENGATIGFAEASIRSDYVNGCSTSPVVFLEGIFVLPEHRRKGAARLLCSAVAAWGKQRNCTEMASDALIDNEISHRMHEALGFEEMERVVFYRKALAP